MRGEDLARQFAEFARAIEIAWDRSSILRALERAAQRRARRQIAGGNDDESIARRRILEEAIEDRANIVARVLNAHQPPTTHQAEARRLVMQPRRVLRQPVG